MYKVPILNYYRFLLNKELSVIVWYQQVQGCPGVPPNPQESNITKDNIRVKPILS